MLGPVYFSQMRAVVARHLAAEQSLDSAARDLSAIMGSLLLTRSRCRAAAEAASTGHAPPQRILITRLPVEQVAWLREPDRQARHSPQLSLGFGGSLADQPRVRALMRAALAHLHVWQHVWRRFGQDAA